MNPDVRIERAGLLYERAVFGGEAGALETAGRELDAVEADLVLAPLQGCGGPPVGIWGDAGEGAEGL